MRSADEHDPESAGEPAPAITPAMFAEWRAPRLGASNPERLTNPVWEWLVQSEHSAYSASRHFGLASDVCREPGWSFARFGRSTTMLEDGRTVLIAGEHEDAYDADSRRGRRQHKRHDRKVGQYENAAEHGSEP